MLNVAGAEVKVKRKYWVTGYVGEGAAQMLSELQDMENVQLLEKVISNRLVRFLYYRLSKLTGQFTRAAFVKRLFYPWYAIFHEKYDSEGKDCLLFINSGFCKEYDEKVIDRVRRKFPDLRFILYIVDPMSGFETPEHMRIIRKMDLVFSINREDCLKYGFRYYPLVYSVSERAADKQTVENDLYYLGSGDDRNVELQQIYEKCERMAVNTQIHVLAVTNSQMTGICFHRDPIPYEENLKLLKQSNCILEVMHKKYDNPTQRYSEAVVYNKKLLTNNPKTAEFDFYNPKYMQIFHSIEEIDYSFVKEREEVNYGYKGEFSPKLFIEEIQKILDEGEDSWMLSVN